MAETSVIKGFLVSLGFKTDESSLKNFTSGIERASFSVLKLAAVVEATALAVAIGVARFSANLESLYYSAQRVGTTATHLKAFENTARNLGSTAAEAQGSMEGLAKFLRDHPQSAESLLRVPTRDAMGRLRDMKDIMIDLGKYWQTLPTYRASQYASLFGISDNMMLALRSGKFEAEQKRQETMIGPGFDAAAEGAHRLQVKIQDLKTSLQRLVIQIQTTLEKEFGLSIDKAISWLQKNGPMLSGRLQQLITDLMNLQKVIGPALGWLYNKFIALDKVTDGWSTKILLALGALKYFGGGQIIGGIAGLAKSLFLMTGPIGLVAAGLTAAAGAAAWIYKSSQTGPTMGSTTADFTDWLKSFGNKGKRNNNPGNLRFAGQPGAINMGGFAHFGTMDQGIQAMANQLELYAGRGINTVDSIIAKWAPASENDLPAYIADVKKRMGLKSSSTALNLHDPATLSHLMNAIAWHETGDNQWVQLISDIATRTALDPSKGAPMLVQYTTIHLHGTNKDAAEKVERAQSRVNSTLSRHFSTAVK